MGELIDDEDLEAFENIFKKAKEDRHEFESRLKELIKRRNELLADYEVNFESYQKGAREDKQTLTNYNITFGHFEIDLKYYDDKFFKKIDLDIIEIEGLQNECQNGRDGKICTRFNTKLYNLWHALNELFEKMNGFEKELNQKASLKSPVETNKGGKKRRKKTKKTKKTKKRKSRKNRK